MKKVTISWRASKEGCRWSLCFSISLYLFLSLFISISLYLSLSFSLYLSLFVFLSLSVYVSTDKKKIAAEGADHFWLDNNFY
jgi:hypothetical protein